MGPVLPAPRDILPDGEGETFNLKEIPKSKGVQYEYMRRVSVLDGADDGGSSWAAADGPVQA